MTQLPAADTNTELWIRRLAPLFLLLAAFAAYANSFNGPFVFDDYPTIVENPTIRQLWPLSEVLSPPSNTGLTVNGRPLVNLSLAINYAFGGIDPTGYHVGNFALHVLAGFTLFGVMRLTLLQSRLRGPFGQCATPLACVIAAIWLLHPLQTAAVTYVVQRAEVLVGLFYLLTVYAFIRSLRSSRALRWKFAAFAACLCGMATKEVMVSAPLMVLLYDRAFIAGSFAGALRSRWRFHAALASTWFFLGWLMIQSGGRGGTAGFALPVSPLDYAITQIGAVVHYLRLAIWPSPLVFDYGGTILIKNLSAVWPQAVVLVVLMVATLLALKRNSPLGFAGMCFFAILAPSSSIVPIADTMFEHRMYLPLAPLIAALGSMVFSRLRFQSLPLLLATALALGISTAHRNRAYASELALWADTVAKRPGNVRAHYTLGSVLAAQDRLSEAVNEYEKALRLKPDSVETLNNLGNLLARSGHLAEARQHYERVLELRPDSADAHNNLGNVLLREGRSFQAMAHYEAALRIDPSFADAHNNLGNLQMRLGERAEAIAHYEAALRSRAGFFDAQLNLANALAESGRLAEARAHYATALQLRPHSAEANYNYGVALEQSGDRAAAIRQYDTTLQLAPTHAQARAALNRLR